MFLKFNPQYSWDNWLKMKVLIIVIVVVSGLNIVASEELAADSNVKFIATKSKNDDDDVDEKYFCSAKCDAFPKNTFCGYNKLKVMKTFINQCEMYVENCHTKLGEYFV